MGVQWEVLDFQVPVANLQIFLIHHYKKNVHLNVELNIL